MNDAVWIRGRDSGGDVVVGLDEGDSSRDGEGPVSPPWAVPLWAFTLPIHNKQSCCCFGREIRMPGRYRQPSNRSSIESISAV